MSVRPSSGPGPVPGPVAGPPNRPAGPPPVYWTDLGRLDYEPAWTLQRRIVERLKKASEEREPPRAVQGGSSASARTYASDEPDRLLLVEHEPVLTMGRRAKEEHILLPRAELARRDVSIIAVERGGDVTYHGPGQLVAYPLLDLRRHRKDVRWYATSLLRTVARTVEAFGVQTELRDGVESGVWVPAGSGSPAAKIAAIGVRIERWIGYHGIALNVDPDIEHFDWIMPCGLPHARTTSLSRVLGRSVDLDEVRPIFLSAFAETFAVSLLSAPVPHGSATLLEEDIP